MKLTSLQFDLELAFNKVLKTVLRQGSQVFNLYCGIMV